MPKKETRRVKDRKFHYTYLIIDNIDNMYYYGVHSTDYSPEDIHQYHSSSKHLNRVIAYKGIENFTKKVRRYFSSREKADLWEHKVLRRLKVSKRADFYNQKEGGVGYVASGYTVVRCRDTGKTFRVPCEDKYIGIYYDPISKGRKLPEEQKKSLSELYKGKWVGEDNPVHELKNDSEWRLLLSEINSGKKLTEEQKVNLKDYSHWGHLTTTKASDKVLDRMKFNSAINNNRHSIYLYKGEVYLHPHELPVTVKTLEVEVVQETHPLVPVLKAGKGYYPDIKTAAKDLGVFRNTISNRIKNNHPCWKDYYFLPEKSVLLSKKVSDESFKKEMEVKYKSILKKQKDYVKPFSVGKSDEECSRIFMGTGKFLKGTTFHRLPDKNIYGYYADFEVYCPLCSEDDYVKDGVCTGKFKSSYQSLKSGYRPCRCGDPKGFSKEIYLYHVKLLCEKEGLTFSGVNGEWVGKKESKLIWICRKGNTHYDTRVGLFLEGGSRCKCCLSENIKNPPEKVNVNKRLKNGSFGEAMTYVALSRFTDTSNIYLKYPLKPEHIKVNKEILEWVRSVQ